MLDFHADDYHRSSKSKDVYEDQIRVFLRYCSSKGLCSDGLAIALNKLMIPQIVSLNDNSIITGTENQQKITLSEIDRFLESLSTKKYGLSVMKYSRHILSLLYIFLDMHHLGINEVILWKWFEQVKPLLGTNWKQARRTLCQFWIFLSTGEIYTGFTGDPATADTLESLPDWCSVPLRQYLELLKREGWKNLRLPCTVPVTSDFAGSYVPSVLIGFQISRPRSCINLMNRICIKLRKEKPLITVESETFFFIFMTRSLL